MDNGRRRNYGGTYSAEQIKRVLAGAGIDIVSEIDSDYIIFCPYHNNYRSPAGEVDKRNGVFFCFSCQKTADLIEFVMYSSSRTYFEAARFIKSKETETDLTYDVEQKLNKKPDFVQYDQVLIKRLN